MAQRIAVCRAVLHRPALLLLDEPHAHLDPEAAALVEPLIGRASGATRVLVSHDVERALAEADRVLGLRDGRVVVDAPAGEVDAGCRARRLRRRRDESGAARSRARTCWSSCGPRSPCPAMALFAVTTFVIFHFGLDRDRLEGELAAGVLWVTLLFAAILGINRLFVAEREQAGFDGILMAPIERTSLLVAKAGALFVYLVALELIALPVFALFFIDSGFWEALPRLALVVAAGGRRARRRGRDARLDRGPHAGAGPAAADPAAAAHRARRDRRRGGHRAPALGPPGHRRDCQMAGGSRPL